MNQYKILSIILSVVSVALLGGMLYLVYGNSNEEPKSKVVSTTEFTTTKLTTEGITTEIQTTITTIGEMNQQVVRNDYPGYAMIPSLTGRREEPPITYANLQGTIPGDGWLYQVRLVIEEHLGKSLDNATNKEIERAILEISSRNGFENAVKTPVTIP